MLQNSLIVFEQISVMYLIILLGVWLYRKGHLSTEVTKKLSYILSAYATPCCVVESFYREFELGAARSLGLTFLGAVLAFGMSIFVAGLLFPKSKPTHRICVILTNNGFMALPLVNAMFGADGVFLVSAHVAVMNVILWTYVVQLLNPGSRPSLRKALLTPGVIATVIGLLVFVSPVKPPKALFSAVGYVGDLTTPLGMLVLGAYLAQADLKALFLNRDVWKTSCFRMLLIPMLFLPILLLLPLDATARITLMVAVAAPAGIVCATFSQMYDGDYLFASRVVSLTTLLSLILLPGWIAVLSGIFQWLPGF